MPDACFNLGVVVVVVVDAVACDRLDSGVPSIQNVRSCLNLLLSLGQLVDAQRWADVEVACTSPDAEQLAHPATRRIVSAALLEARTRIVEGMLHEALGFRPTSSGYVRVADNLTISQVLAARTTRGVTDEYVATLATVAEAFLKLRHSMQGRQRSAKAKMFAWFEQHRSFCSPALVAELAALRQQSDNSDAVAAITEVLSRFRTRSSSDHGNQPSVFETDELQRMLDQCKAMPAVSSIF